MSKEVFKIKGDAINAWGGLYRTQYLVLSRTMLEAMPDEWQERFVGMMEEVTDQFDVNADGFPHFDYQVRAIDSNGRYIQDPWGQYRYPNQELIDKYKNPTQPAITPERKEENE